MKTQSPDTHPEIEKIQIEAYRKMPAWEKLQRVRDQNRFLERLITAKVREQYPEADEREIKLRVAVRRLGPDLIRKWFGWDVEREGY